LRQQRLGVFRITGKQVAGGVEAEGETGERWP